MSISELIQKLENMRDTHGDRQIMILDGFNAGGYPRTINLGPILRTIDPTHAADCGDCEDRVNEVIAILGYGYY